MAHIIIQVVGEDVLLKFPFGANAAAVLEALDKDPRAGPGTLWDKDEVAVLSTVAELKSEQGPYIYRRQHAGREPTTDAC